MDKTKIPDVETYISGSSEEARPILEELRQIIKSTLPEAEEKISYGVPLYKYNGDYVGYAAYKNHVSFGFGKAVLQDEDRAALEKLGYPVAKGTMQIKFGQKVPSEFIVKILKAKGK
jgi:uncharacterized protein YdhG (YjbR/CyaY superfamily)